ncbi:putative transcriptional regulator [Actinomadura rupiterrae]|nr:putative transcriptional regulator [Actinomadura rupiterrae]
MTILQEAEDALGVSEVQAKLGGDLAYTTVQTILARMLTKGVLIRLPSGRGHVYAPVADPSGLAALRMREVLDQEPDRREVLSRFIGALSDKDGDILRDLLEPQ